MSSSFDNLTLKAVSWTCEICPNSLCSCCQDQKRPPVSPGSFWLAGKQWNWIFGVSSLRGRLIPPLTFEEEESGSQLWSEGGETGERSSSWEPLRQRSQHNYWDVNTNIFSSDRRPRLRRALTCRSCKADGCEAVRASYNQIWRTH